MNSETDTLSKSADDDCLGDDKCTSLQEKQRNKSKMNRDIFFAVLARAGLVILGYIVAYMNWSVILLMTTIGTLVWLEYKTYKSSRSIRSKARASNLNKEELKKLLNNELPTWVTFPDRERAEWLNEIIMTLWPNISNFIIKKCRSSIQTNIRKKFDSFRFEEIDFGGVPPKIDGVKMYSKKKDCIIIDFDVFYDGDCDINFSISGTQIGRLKDFQMQNLEDTEDMEVVQETSLPMFSQISNETVLESDKLGVEVRVVLKPLLTKMPLVGGIQVFFLNTPDLHFDIEGISKLPGLNYFLRQKIEQKLRKTIVFPNSVSKRFTKSVEAAELKSLEPDGILRVHVFEAKDLEKKDVTGKSDPYVVLTVGAQQFTTKVIKKSLNPKWDDWCEFIVLDPLAQQLYFKLYDQDDFNEDDFLGSGAAEIHTIVKPGNKDQWFTLEKARHGQIHLRFSWLGLSPDLSDLQAVVNETRLLNVSTLAQALLTIYVDSARELPKTKYFRKPDCYFKILLNDTPHFKSKTKKHTVEPVWEQGTSILIPHPNDDIVKVLIYDKSSDVMICFFQYPIRNLTSMPHLQISKEVFPLSTDELDSFESQIVLSLQLRILTNAFFECEDESDSDLDEVDTCSRMTIEGRDSSSPSEIPSPDIKDNSPVTQTSLSLSTSCSSITKKNVTPVYSSLEKLESQKPLLNTCGKIEITINYNEMRQRLIVKVHQVQDLPAKDADDPPDPYVKIKLMNAGGSPKKYKTRVIPNNCNPVFEEPFEFLLAQEEFPKSKLVLTAKTKSFFNSTILGQVIINFEKLGAIGENHRFWREFGPEQESD